MTARENALLASAQMSAVAEFANTDSGLNPTHGARQKSSNRNNWLRVFGALTAAAVIAGAVAAASSGGGGVEGGDTAASSPSEPSASANASGVGSTSGSEPTAAAAAPSATTSNCKLPDYTEEIATLTPHEQPYVRKYMQDRAEDCRKTFERRGKCRECNKPWRIGDEKGIENIKDWLDSTCRGQNLRIDEGPPGSHSCSNVRGDPPYECGFPEDSIERACCCDPANAAKLEARRRQNRYVQCSGPPQTDCNQGQAECSVLIRRYGEDVGSQRCCEQRGGPDCRVHLECQFGKFVYDKCRRNPTYPCYGRIGDRCYKQRIDSPRAKSAYLKVESACLEKKSQTVCDPTDDSTRADLDCFWSTQNKCVPTPAVHRAQLLQSHEKRELKLGDYLQKNRAAMTASAATERAVALSYDPTPVGSTSVGSTPVLRQPDRRQETPFEVERDALKLLSRLNSILEGCIQPKADARVEVDTVRKATSDIGKIVKELKTASDVRKIRDLAKETEAVARRAGCSS